MSLDMPTASVQQVRTQPVLRAPVMPTRPIPVNGSVKRADEPQAALEPKVGIKNLWLGLRARRGAAALILADPDLAEMARAGARREALRLA